MDAVVESESTCSATGYQDCSFLKYQDNQECILHSSKEKASRDYHMARAELSDFKTELIKYILNTVFKHKDETEVFSKTVLFKYLNDPSSIQDEAVKDKLLKITLVLNHVAFPVFDERDNENYIPMLNLFGKIHFNFCKLYVSWIELKDTKVFFQDCEFYEDWYLHNYISLSDDKEIDDVIYQSCSFTKEISASGSGGFSKKLVLKSGQFRDCKFKEMNFNDVIFEKPIFSNSKGFQGEITDFSSSNCILKERFSLKYLTINSLDILDTTFDKSLEFKKVSISHLRIMDSTFKGLVNCFNCSFYDFYIHQSTFEEFVGFEYSRFGLSLKDEKEGSCSEFPYVTFLSFVNFRNTSFYSGLELSEANFKEYPNFLGTNINPKNTDVETYRIIKHSFDKVGNSTEANKYFALEMDKTRKETVFWIDPEQKIILGFNNIISRFGQSFLLPLIWIFLLMIVHHLTLDWISTFPTTSPIMNHLVSELNGLVKNVIPFKRFLNPGTEFLSLLFLIGYSTFIYHFIVAIKRRTKI